MKNRITNRTRLLILSATANELQFASVNVDGVEIYYDAACDGAEVWVLDAEGNPAPAPALENVEIEGAIYDIVDSVLVAKEVEMEDVTPEAIASLQQLVSDLEARIAALEEKLNAPAVEPAQEGQFSKSNSKRRNIITF